MISRSGTTTPISSVCAKCGIIQKSGKRSCCSRGGSWFGQCVSAGNADLGHTWYEGIRVCEARQSQAVVVQRLHGPQPESKASSDDITSEVTSTAANASIDISVSMLTLKTIAIPVKLSTVPPLRPEITPSPNLTIDNPSGRPGLKPCQITSQSVPQLLRRNCTSHCLSSLALTLCLSLSVHTNQF